MKKFDSNMEKDVFQRFQSNLNHTSFNLVTKDKWKTSGTSLIIDLVIYKGGYPLAVVEVKGALTGGYGLLLSKELVRMALSISNARFGIVTDNELFYVYDRNNKESDFVQSDFQSLIELLNQPGKIKIDKKVKDEIYEIILNSASMHLQEKNEFNQFLRSKNFSHNIAFDDESNTFYFVENNLGSFENKFFNKLLGEFNEKEVCRYTTLRSFFEMINNMSFRMNGLVGMNDRSEVNYFESYIDGFERPLSKETSSTISKINDRYITSCTLVEKKDDLTLWRLYSDDAKGVCLIFDINSKKLNSHVLLQKVKYADENGVHKELDFLKQFKEKVESLTGFKFEFRKTGNWKHFFKPYEYSIEEEVRLLIIDKPSLEKIKSDWVMTYSHSIINPIIDFKLNSVSFPIRLKEVILGPKCPEQDTNLVQIKEMIKRKLKDSIGTKRKKINVELSNIKHYR